MKVRITKNYNDTQLKELVKAGTELEVSKERAEELINAKVAVADQAEETVEETAEETAEEKPKKRKKAEA